MVGYRRARGAVLRLAHARLAATLSGLALTVCSVLLMAFDFVWESWLTDGLGLVLGATGVALIAMGLGGRQPDWIDP